MPLFLHGTVAEVAFNGGWGVRGTLFAILWEERLDLTSNLMGN
jgi:hypothetical protein